MKKIFFTILSTVGLLKVNDFVYAQGGLEKTADAAKLTKYGESIPDIVGKILGVGLSFVAVLFFALMLYAGIRWMIARGNEEEAKKSLDMIIASVIGLGVVLASYALTSFVFAGILSGGDSKITGSGKEPEPKIGVIPGCCRYELPNGIVYKFVGGQDDCDSICGDAQAAQGGIQKMNCSFKYSITSKEECNVTGWNK